MRTSRKLRWGSAAMILGMGVFGSGIALATVPDGNTVHACRKNTGGALRIPTSQTCQSGETAVNWSSWNFRGTWSQTSTYKKGDVVTFMGSSLVATADIPVGGQDNWAVVAQAGKTGPAGQNGVSAAYEARCTICNLQTAHPDNTWVTVVSLTLPAGNYRVSAHASPINYNVFDGEMFYCAIVNNTERDRSTINIDAAGLGGHQQHGEVTVEAVGSFSGKVTLQCAADESWHVDESVITAVAVDKVTKTSAP